MIESGAASRPRRQAVMRSGMLLAFASGILTAFAFPLGPPLPPFRWNGSAALGWICLAPLLCASLRAKRAREALCFGASAGFVAFTLILAWLPLFLVRWGRLSAVEAIAVFVLLLSWLALWPALFAMGVRRIASRRGAVTACMAAAVLWPSLELARGRLATGFPWALLGYSQEGFLAAWQPAELGGVYAVSFCLACFSASVALAWWRRGVGPVGRQGRLAERVVLVLALIAAAGPAFGLIRMRVFNPKGPSTDVALVQANVAQSSKWNPGEASRIEAEHSAMTLSAAAAGAKTIVWSESSVPLSITDHPEYAARLVDLAREAGADLIVGTVTYGSAPAGPRVPYNSALAITPHSGASAQYDKRHLVPFGEYVPLKRALFFLNPLVAEASDFGSGKGTGLFRAGDHAFAALICYEAIFPELLRPAVLSGAAAILNLTNDAWYGDTAMPRQHLAMARLRAVESKRWLLRCANTGISALVDPLGRITARSHLDEKALVSGTINLVTGTTIYMRMGDAFAWACAIVASLLLLLPHRFPIPLSEPPEQPRSHHGTFGT